MVISDDLIEKYLLGEASLSEMMQVELAAKIDDEVAERLLVAKRFEKMIEAQKREELPLERMAAKSKDNMCAILCERHILEKMYPDYCDRTIFTDAKEERAFLDGLSSPGKEKWIDSARCSLREEETAWLTDKGTAMYNIGRVLEHNGLSTTRKFLCDPDDLKEALEREEGVIVVVKEAILMGEGGDDIPDHAVCVLAIDGEKVCLYNPSSEQIEYPLKVFLHAWETSGRYAVFADKPEKKRYDPHPLHILDNVELEDGLEDLKDALAEFAHDNWAEERIREGFIYGPKNVSEPPEGEPKTNMYLKPFSELPERSKEHERMISMNTLKLLKFLGYTIEKTAGDGYVCPDCGKRIKLEWSYCSCCGRFLEISDFKKKADQQ